MKNLDGHMMKFAVAGLIAAAGPLCAQWTTESYSLESGWSGIWLPHDCSHVNIDALLQGKDDVLEVWQWNPLGSTGQFSASPWLPLQADAAWKVWRRGDPASSTLGAMTGNSAYLVRVKDSAQPVSLTLTGKPLLPRYEFSTSGSNFVGFPMREPTSTSDRSFERFFSFSEVLKTQPPVFYYRNGALSAQYPVQALPRTTAVQRGRAYWVKNDVYTDYYGPLKVTMLGTGLHFGATGNLISLRIKNVVDPAKNQAVTFTLKPAASASPPAGQGSPVAGQVPLQVRGLRDPQTQEFQYTPISGTGLSRTLAPGEETVLTVAVNRSAMGGAAGGVFQSLLEVTDSLNQSRIVLPVSAETTSFEGLWAGAAVITTVDQVIGQTLSTDATAPSQFTIRLLAHRKADGTTTLLQQIYQGESAAGPVAGTNEASVKAASSTPLSRMSSSAFPLSMAVGGSGSLQREGPVRFRIDLGYNASTNPFVHTYHPDHDNLDARFERSLPDGAESYSVSRTVTLDFLPAMPGITDPGWGSTLLGGTYRETLSGLRSTPVSVSGSFLLHRISSVPTLTP